MLAAVRAELLDLETIGIVAAVLLGDVVAVLAHLARQGDLGANVCGGGHWIAFFRVVRGRDRRFPAGTATLSLGSVVGSDV